MRAIYTAANEEAGLAALDEFEKKIGAANTHSHKKLEKQLAGFMHIFQVSSRDQKNDIYNQSNREF